MKQYIRVFAIFLMFMQIVTLYTSVNTEKNVISAQENGNITGVAELKPSFSALSVDINDPLIISYENISITDYECSLIAEGIEASIIQNESNLKCEIKAIDGSEFGILTVTAISSDGDELLNTVYTYNNGENLYYSEFAKDQAWYYGTEILYNNANAEGTLDVFSYRYWEEQYSNLMSSILNGTPVVVSSNNEVTKISGNIEWEIDKSHITLPLRNAYIEIISKNDYSYNVLADGYTDEEGYFDLSISNEVFSQSSEVYFRINLEAQTFKVRSGWHTFPYYFDKKLSGIINEGNNVTFNPCITYDESLKIYKATYVHQAMAIAERFALQMGFEAPYKVRIAYPAGKEDISDPNEPLAVLSKMAFCWGNGENNAYCAIGWYSYNNTQMIVHEYSHYIQSCLGNYGEELLEILIENPNHDGISDYLEAKEDKSFAMHLAWTEGWGYAFSVMAQKYYQNEYSGMKNYDTTQALINIYNHDDFYGEFQEKTVKAFLWELLDQNKIVYNPNTPAEELDYQLPWTPQEWWNMTTVPGTCRFPDFMRLIEEEDYDESMDIDYKALREDIAYYLTKYNIAPQINSITYTSGTLNISVEVNGSEAYPNNCLVVKVFDENNNLLAESIEFPTNVGRYDPYSLTELDDLWSEVLSNYSCANGHTATIKISVEGYREDTTDPDGSEVGEEFQVTGPYYSEYHSLSLSFPHNYYLEDIGDGYHAQECFNCGHVDEDTIEEHSFDGWVFVSDTLHRSECECGVRGSTTSPHTFRMPDSPSDPRICIGCGYTKFLGGNGGNIIISISKVTVNGSYQMPDGTVYLVDADIEAYLNGTLVFYDKDKLPVVQ